MSSSDYSISCMSLLKCASDYHEIFSLCNSLGSRTIELVPSFVLGIDWDKTFEWSSFIESNVGHALTNDFKVTSIQSLTYGLEISLGSSLHQCVPFLKRLEVLNLLALSLSTDKLVLGSPSQKKHNNDPNSLPNFVDNAMLICSRINNNINLCLEHNTIVQGAEIFNTLGQVCNLIHSLRGQGIGNARLNLDTTCLLHEFGDSYSIKDLDKAYGISEIIGSIQIGQEFVKNELLESRNHLYMLEMSQAANAPISLEEPGINRAGLIQFVEGWRELLRSA